MKKLDKKIKFQILNGPEDAAATTLTKILTYPNLGMGELSNFAKLLMDKGRFGLAARIFAKWAELSPKDPLAWSNLGGSLARMNLHEEAKNVLIHALDLNPRHTGARINLCGVYQAMGEHDLQLEMALSAVQHEPSSWIAFNNLGSALKDKGLNEEAKHAFQTSVMLSSDAFYPNFNLAKIESELGNTASAIDFFEKALHREMQRGGAEIDQIKYHLAFDYLRSGNLEKGFEYYDYGFSEKILQATARHPKRKFEVPMWDGTPLKQGQRLLVWREQGVGDMIAFGSCLKLLEKEGIEVILEVENRLVSVLQRSFPSFMVRTQRFTSNLHSPVSDYDFHIPIGSLCKFYLRTHEDIKRLGPYIRPEANLKKMFSERLAQFGNKPKIGICWRSGNLSVRRNSSYTSLSDWGDILKISNVTFVNLQYDDCEQELIDAENSHNIEIVRWKDIDLKNDLEAVFSLMSNLDAVITVGTAVLPFAGAIGLRGIGLLKKSWVLLGCENIYPWFPQITPLAVGTNEFVALSLPKVPALLETCLAETSKFDCTIG